MVESKMMDVLETILSCVVLIVMFWMKLVLCLDVQIDA
jgi:hypothetical protein